MSRILAVATLIILSGCSSAPVHRGLSRDGYGFADHSPHLAPPADLAGPAPTKETPAP